MCTWSSMHFSKEQNVTSQCLILRSVGCFLGDTDHLQLHTRSFRNESISEDLLWSSLGQNKVLVDLEKIRAQI